MKETIYLIGSLRLNGVREFAEELRGLGFDVFDDWHAAGYKNPGQRDPLGYMILTCEEIYDVGMHLIKNYDRLENIE